MNLEGFHFNQKASDIVQIEPLRTRSQSTHCPSSKSAGHHLRAAPVPK